MSMRRAFRPASLAFVLALGTAGFAQTGGTTGTQTGGTQSASATGGPDRPGGSGWLRRPTIGRAAANGPAVAVSPSSGTLRLSWAGGGDPPPPGIATPRLAWPVPTSGCPDECWFQPLRVRTDHSS